MRMLDACEDAPSEQPVARAKKTMSADRGPCYDRQIKQDDPDDTLVTPRASGVQQRFPGQPLRSAANDNDCVDSWPQVPSSDGYLVVSGQHDFIQRLCGESACMPLLCEELANPLPIQANFRSSWKVTEIGLHTAVLSIGIFGWLSVLWLAIVSLVRGMIS